MKMEKRPNLLARGELLQAIVGLPIIGAAVAASGSAADAADNKKQFKYQDKPDKSGKKCSQCRLFRAPSACQVVTGKISPDGWCIAWVKR